MFEFSNINSKINFEICSKLAIEAPDVLVSLVLTLNIFGTLFKCFFVDFEHVNGRWKTSSLNLNLSMYFRVGFRSPVTFKMKLYVTKVSNTFWPLPIFCHKELHLRGRIELDLNIVTWSTNIECILWKIWKTYPPRCPKNTYSEVFSH